MDAFVAPLAGAWIETRQTNPLQHVRQVAPLAGAWIETIAQSLVDFLGRSPPSRGRGLKLLQQVQQQASLASPPSRGRGLKLCVPALAGRRAGVAPLAGAWIETDCVGKSTIGWGRRPPRGGVD